MILVLDKIGSVSSYLVVKKDILDEVITVAYPGDGLGFPPSP